MHDDGELVDGQYVLMNDLVALNNRVQELDADWSLAPALTDEVLTRVRRIVAHDPSQEENLQRLVRWASGIGLVESVQRGTQHFDVLYDGLKEIFPNAEG